MLTATESYLLLIELIMLNVGIYGRVIRDLMKL